MGRGSSHEGQHSLEAYADQVARTRLLSREEERELAIEARGGDDRARDAIVQANLRLAFSIAASYRSGDVPLADLVAAANVGLIWAATRYDPTRGARFATYAAFWVHRMVRETLDEGAHDVRLPQHAGDKLQRVIAAADDLYQKLERRITVAEVSEASDLPHSTVAILIGLSSNLLNICAFGEFTSAGGEAVDAHLPESYDRIPDYPFEVHQHVEFLLSRLSERESYVLRAYYGLGDGEVHSMAEIGRRLGLTRERVRQIRREALARARECAEYDGEGEAG